MLGSISGGYPMRPVYPSTGGDPNPDNLSFFNLMGYNGGQSTGPSRNCSEPSLFPNLSSVSRSGGTDWMSSRLGGSSKSQLPDARTVGGFFGSNMSSEPSTSSSNVCSSLSRGVKLDPSEFPPILNSVSRGPNTATAFPSVVNQPPPRNYLSVMSKGSENTVSNLSQSYSQLQGAAPEFSKQDFPALPGQHPMQLNSTDASSIANTCMASSSISALSRPLSSAHSSSTCVANSMLCNRSFNQSSTSISNSAAGCFASPSFGQGSLTSSGNNGLQLLSNHRVTNIPKNMICDQFGMLGLLKLIRVGDHDATLNMLAPGLDLSSLHTNWQSTGELYNTFISPCHDSCIGRPQDMDFAVPPEYLIRHLIADRLPDPPLDQLSDETLFWLFYNCCREDVQLVVAKELYQREWRFHKKKQIWLTRVMGANFTTDSTSEHGEYYFWDPLKAQKSTHQMAILYSDLDDAPSNFRLSSNTLSAFVNLSLPNGPSLAAHSGASHSNFAPQHLAAYQQQQQQQQQHQQSNYPPPSMLTRASMVSAVNTQSSGPRQSVTASQQMLPQGSSIGSPFASLFSAAQQQQQSQLSPTTAYFQTQSNLHTSRSVGAAGGGGVSGGSVQTLFTGRPMSSLASSAPINTAAANTMRSASPSNAIPENAIGPLRSDVSTTHTNAPTAPACLDSS